MEKASEKLELILKYFSEFSERQLQQLKSLDELYTYWNSQINVISRKDIDSLYLHHVLHSLSIAAVIDFLPGREVIDIGTGGGFPGIPLAIFFPEVQFHLVDSIAKKLKVVEEVAKAAGIPNVTTQHIRAEEIKGRKFDFAVSRAVAPLKDLIRWTQVVVKKGEDHELPNGLICLKGGDLSQEVADTNARPHIFPISGLIPETYFEEKYILHVTR